MSTKENQKHNFMIYTTFVSIESRFLRGAHECTMCLRLMSELILTAARCQLHPSDSFDVFDKRNNVFRSHPAGGANTTLWLCVRSPVVSHSQSRPSDPRPGRGPRLQPGPDSGWTLVLHHCCPIRRSVLAACDVTVCSSVNVVALNSLTSLSSSCLSANEGKVRMISCGADKSVYFRTAQQVRRVMSLMFGRRRCVVFEYIPDMILNSFTHRSSALWS